MTSEQENDACAMNGSDKKSSANKNMPENRTSEQFQNNAALQSNKLNNANPINIVLGGNGHANI